MERGVSVNVEAIKATMKERKVTAADVSRSFGLTPNWLSNILCVGRASEQTVEKLERALFAEAGAFAVNEEPKEEPEGGAAKDNGDAVIKLLQELVKNTAIIRAQGEEIIGAIRSASKDAKDQRAVIITKETSIETAVLKVRSAIERKGE